MTDAPELHWGEPPEARVGSPAKYRHILDTLRSRPGEWARLVVPGQNDLSYLVTQINQGRIVGSKPAGAFQATSRSAEDGVHLYVRYVGEGNSDPGAE